MSLLSALAIYFIIWWVVLFAVLPWGATSAHELGHEPEEGHAPSAPVSPNLIRKFLVTTVIAAVLFAGFHVLSTSGLVRLEDIPFLPDFPAQ